MMVEETSQSGLEQHTRRVLVEQGGESLAAEVRQPTRQQLGLHEVAHVVHDRVHDELERRGHRERLVVVCWNVATSSRSRRCILLEHVDESVQYELLVEQILVEHGLHEARGEVPQSVQLGLGQIGGRDDRQEDEAQIVDVHEALECEVVGVAAAAAAAGMMRGRGVVVEVLNAREYLAQELDERRAPLGRYVDVGLTLLLAHVVHVGGAREHHALQVPHGACHGHLILVQRDEYLGQVVGALVEHGYLLDELGERLVVRQLLEPRVRRLLGLLVARDEYERGPKGGHRTRHTTAAAATAVATAAWRASAATAATSTATATAAAAACTAQLLAVGVELGADARLLAPVHHLEQHAHHVGLEVTRGGREQRQVLVGALILAGAQQIGYEVLEAALHKVSTQLILALLLFHNNAFEFSFD